MMELFFSPYTDAAPKMYLREASRRVKKPPNWFVVSHAKEKRQGRGEGNTPMRLALIKTWVSSSLYL